MDDLIRTPVAQWAKLWPADVAVMGSSPTCREALFNILYRVPLHTAFHYHPHMVLI